ncbi:MAG: 16S rRNA (uracil(1498)-N(3))-methyltransferase [Chloroflexi bacterium]|nr:16S rRNA (uracil(1498)-N(3))-methyltransferase [Chloroflexota bacterium]
MHRFFIDPQSIAGNQAVLDRAISHQIRDVLHLDTGEQIVLLDNSGYELEAGITGLGRENVTAEITGRRYSPAEPATVVRLYQGLLKGARFELVLQKGTELGVSFFIPVLFERSVPSGEYSAARLDRWRKIIAEAAEQSGRARLPALLPVTPFPDACRQAPGLRLLPWEEEKRTGVREVLEGWKSRSGPDQHPVISVFIGPEGGITAGEVELARQNGVAVVSLGPRILRAETAALAAVTLVLY